MDEPPSENHRKPRRLAAICGAAVAAALFTPVPATADTAHRPQPQPAVQTVAAVHHTPSSAQLAHSLISTGMIGIGLAMGGLVIVTHRRRQW